MKYGRQEMLRINGNTSNDHLVASEFCQAVLQKAKLCHQTVSDIRNLKVWLDKLSMQDAKDAIATLRQIDDVVNELGKFHKSGELGLSLKNLGKEALKLSAEAELFYAEISGLYP
jgi:hypothetical protein